MIDIQLVRESPELLKKNIKKKFQDEKMHLVDKAKDLDEKWRKLKQVIDNLRHERNVFSEKINQAKKNKDEKKAKELIKKAKEIPPEIAKKEEDANKIEEELKGILMQIPNLIHESVPIGKSDKENVDKLRIGKPRTFNFPIKTHQEIGKKLGMIDFEVSGDMAGTGFYLLKDKVALLNQALVKFTIDKMTSKGFMYIETPLMLREKVIRNVTDLADMKNQIYKIQDEDLYLIGTSEHSLIGRYIGKLIKEEELPIKNTSYSMCFRKEIGSHGIDERGLYRTHQFNKVEMIIICSPKESMKFFEEIKKISLEIMKDLEIPCRVLEICSGDLGDLKHIQVDIEAWSPKLKDYYEVGSCSNLTGAQARKLGIRAVTRTGDKYTPHTLNNTALATSRALIAILENNQQKDGSVKIPRALWKYTGFKEIKPLKEQKAKQADKTKAKKKK